MSLAPFYRKYGAQYLQNVIVFFVIGLIIIRTFLKLTGFPQLSPGGLHIAHVLWGGLLLFISAIIILIYKNKSLLTISSIMLGLGWALFIDEVGKFITGDNNYFFEFAIVIIYLTFLSLWFLLRHLSKIRRKTDQEKMHIILESLEDVVNLDFDKQAKRDTEKQLKKLSEKSKDINIKNLANALLNSLKEFKYKITKPSRIQRFSLKIKNKIKKIILREPIKHYIFPLLLLFQGASLVFNSVYLSLPIIKSMPIENLLINGTINVNPFESTTRMIFFITMITLQFVVAALLLGGGVLTIFRKPKGLIIAQSALMISITIVDVIILYFDQFNALITVSIGFVFLYWIRYYQEHWKESS